MRIEWHPYARADLVELVTFISEDDPQAAYRVHEAIRQKISNLAIHPEMGRIGRVKGTRELVIGGTPYIAVYLVDRSAVTVSRVLHGARRWPAKF